VEDFHRATESLDSVLKAAVDRNRQYESTRYEALAPTNLYGRKGEGSTGSPFHPERQAQTKLLTPDSHTDRRVQAERYNGLAEPGQHRKRGNRWLDRIVRTLIADIDD
jgi:hypothetical protein